MFTCKAYNGRVVLEWLTRCITSLAQQHPENARLALLASCSYFGSNLYECLPCFGWYVLFHVTA